MFQQCLPKITENKCFSNVTVCSWKAFSLRFVAFLANDVTLVTSYGYCQSLKINDIRDTSVLRSVRLGGYSVRRWVRVCTGTMKPLPYQRHIPLQFILWENARALKPVLHRRVSINRNYLIFFFAINRNYLMLLRMRCFVYFRSGRILFAM